MHIYFFQKKQETADKMLMVEKEVRIEQKGTKKKAPKKTIKKKK